MAPKPEDTASQSASAKKAAAAAAAAAKKPAAGAPKSGAPAAAAAAAATAKKAAAATAAKKHAAGAPQPGVTAALPSRPAATNTGAANNNTPTPGGGLIKRFTMFSYGADSKSTAYDDNSPEFAFVSYNPFVLSIPGKPKTSWTAHARLDVSQLRVSYLFFTAQEKIHHIQELCWLRVTCYPDQRSPLVLILFSIAGWPSES